MRLKRLGPLWVSCFVPYLTFIDASGIPVELTEWTADLAADAHANALVQGQGQGLGQASHPSWSQAQDANQTAYFIPGYGIAGYHSSVDEPNTFLSNEGDAMVTTEQGFGELLQADEPLDNWHGWHDWSATQ